MQPRFFSPCTIPRRHFWYFSNIAGETAWGFFGPKSGTQNDRGGVFGMWRNSELPDYKITELPNSSQFPQPKKQFHPNHFSGIIGCAPLRLLWRHVQDIREPGSRTPIFNLLVFNQTN